MAENWSPLVRIIFSTTEGAVLPACAPHLAPTLLLTNYTRTTYSKYINDSRFTGAGLGHEDGWMVVVLTTSTTGGDFAGATSLVSKDMEEKGEVDKSFEAGTFGFCAEFHLIEARPNAFVQNSLVSQALLCNKDTRDNLLTAFTFKENAAGMKMSLDSFNGKSRKQNRNPFRDKNSNKGVLALLQEMASIKIKIFFPFLLFHAMFLLSSGTVMRCGGGEDNLLENINSYRTSLLGLPALTKNKKASCLAREIADTLWNPCTTDDGPAEFVQLDDYPTELKHCYGDSSHTTDFAILPICIPGNDEQTPVNFQNYSRSQYEKYANESSYSGAGVGAGENWMVIVFVENNKSWSSAGGGKHSLVSGFGFGHGSVSLLLGLLLSYHLVL
ncbi:hypothetical protein OIU74_026458 [Salix koriyanagi]|uniref:Uncharacterized GPI-anchored protein At5g19230-like domain-containing protein n=2 Tax=Salix TaxID=40685 RepID=A0A9Q1A3T7_9ROSI|nr:hypothetical protein OIU74_026458 [Salix koriyanagi]